MDILNQNTELKEAMVALEPKNVEDWHSLAHSYFSKVAPLFVEDNTTGLRVLPNETHDEVFRLTDAFAVVAAHHQTFKKYAGFDLPEERTPEEIEDEIETGRTTILHALDTQDGLNQFAKAWENIYYQQEHEEAKQDAMNTATTYGTSLVGVGLATFTPIVNVVPSVSAILPAVVIGLALGLGQNAKKWYDLNKSRTGEQNTRLFDKAFEKLIQTGQAQQEIAEQEEAAAPIPDGPA